MYMGKVVVRSIDIAQDNFEYYVETTVGGLFWVDWNQQADEYIIYEDSWHSKPWNNHDYISVIKPVILSLKRNKILGIKSTTEIKIDPKDCRHHIFEEYVGFTDVYKFCTKCDYKFFYKDIDYTKIK